MISKLESKTLMTVVKMLFKAHKTSSSKCSIWINWRFLVVAVCRLNLRFRRQFVRKTPQPNSALKLIYFNKVWLTIEQHKHSHKVECCLWGLVITLQPALLMTVLSTYQFAVPKGGALLCTFTSGERKRIKWFFWPLASYWKKITYIFMGQKTHKKCSHEEDWRLI